MSDLNHKECFGKMFPNGLHLKHSTLNGGNVFAAQLSRANGTMPLTSDRAIEINVNQWDDCQLCLEFDSCYKLCLARVALESAIVNQ